MSMSSIYGGERAARRAAGKDVDALGPSDSSDSGSDIQGEREFATGIDQPDELGAMPVDGDTDSDAGGTGERGAATGRDAAEGGDIAPDRIESTAGAAPLDDAVDDADLLAEEDGEPDPDDDAVDDSRPRREPRTP